MTGVDALRAERLETRVGAVRLKPSLLERINQLALCRGVPDAESEQWAPTLLTDIGTDEQGRDFFVLHEVNDRDEVGDQLPTDLIVLEEGEIWRYEIARNGRITAVYDPVAETEADNDQLLDHLNGLSTHIHEMDLPLYRSALQDLTFLMDREGIEYDDWETRGRFVARRVFTIQGFDMHKFKVEQIHEIGQKKPFTRVTVTFVDREDDDREFHRGQFELSESGFTSLDRGLKKVFANRAARKYFDLLTGSVDNILEQ